jgi:hypothetical protein
MSDRAELTVERGAIVLRKPRKPARAGCSQVAESVAAHGEDEWENLATPRIWN